MTTPLDLEIRSRIASVLVGKSKVGDFYRWFVPTTLYIERSNTPEAIRLTYKITHLFSELSAGVLTPGDFKRELGLVASTYVAATTPWNQPMKSSLTLTTSSENDITEDDAPVMVVGTARVAAPA